MCFPAASPPTKEMALEQLVGMLVVEVGVLVIPDVRMVTDKVDTVMLAVDDVHGPVRRPGISEQLNLTTIRTEN